MEGGGWHLSQTGSRLDCGLSECWSEIVESRVMFKPSARAVACSRAREGCRRTRFCRVSLRKSVLLCFAVLCYVSCYSCTVNTSKVTHKKLSKKTGR